MLEDMQIDLLTFTKTLKPSDFHKAEALKEKLEASGHAPSHFRVSLASQYAKAWEHEAVGNYKFVKDKLEDLLVAEKNLNRNIDSKAQLDMFLGTANDVRNAFLKKYGPAEFHM